MSQLDTPKTKILIIRFSAFGDVVQTLSVPTALKNAYPQAEIQWITRMDMSPLVKGHPCVTKVWTFDRTAGLKMLILLALQMRTEKFTHIYDAHNNARSRVVTFILNPLSILGIGPSFIRRSLKRWKRFLLFNFRINKFEQPFSGQRDLLEPLSIWGVSKISPPAPQLFLSETSRLEAANILQGWEDAIALAPSAAHFLKRWPVEHWKTLITQQTSYKFILLGGPEDEFCREIQATAPQRVLNLAGKISLLTSAAVVEKSPAIISNDTWLLHAAEQLGSKAIALMGPAPFGFPSRNKTEIMQLDLKCRPCSKHGQGPCINKTKYHQCMVDITPESVGKILQQEVPVG